MSQVSNRSLVIDCLCGKQIPLSRADWEAFGGKLLRCPDCGNACQVPPFVTTDKLAPAASERATANSSTVNQQEDRRRALTATLCGAIVLAGVLLGAFVITSSFQSPTARPVPIPQAQAPKKPAPKKQPVKPVPAAKQLAADKKTPAAAPQVDSKIVEKKPEMAAAPGDDTANTPEEDPEPNLKKPESIAPVPKSTKDQHLQAVRLWLFDHLSDPEWVEIRWWPAIPESTFFDEELEPKRMICRLQYCTKDKLGALANEDKIFVIEAGKAKSPEPSLAYLAELYFEGKYDPKPDAD